jgi:hypothetical protein
MSSEAATVSGIVARVGGISRRRSAWDGSLAEASSFDDLDLELGGKTIDLHHDGRPIGELVYCELGSDDRFRVVGVVEGLQLDKIDGHLRELRARDARQPAGAARTQLHREGSTASQHRTHPHAGEPGSAAAALADRRHPGLQRPSRLAALLALGGLTAPGPSSTAGRLRTWTASRIIDRREADDGLPFSPGDVYPETRPPGAMRHGAVVRRSVLRIS